MRQATLGFAAVTAIALAAGGCGESADTGSTGKPKTSAGGESVAVGPSRVARPLPAAGPRVNYPARDPRAGEAPHGPETRSDPMLDEDPRSVPMEHQAPLATEERQEMAPGEGLASDAGRTLSSQCLGALGRLSIEVTDVYDGAAIVVTGRTDQVGAIRQRARALAYATAHTPQREGSAVGKPAGAESVDMPPTEVHVVDLAEGVRLQYIADDPEEVIAVRNAVRRLASELRQGRCPGVAAPVGEARTPPR